MEEENEGGILEGKLGRCQCASCYSSTGCSITVIKESSLTGRPSQLASYCRRGMAPSPLLPLLFGVYRSPVDRNNGSKGYLDLSESVKE